MLQQAFFSEVLGTGVLILLGTGLNANMSLRGTKGFGKNWLLVSLGWGLAVFTGIFVAVDSGAHLNPAVTLGKLLAGQPFHEAADGAVLDPSVVGALTYTAAQLLGAFLGACLAWLAYKQQYDQPAEPGVILGTFSTGPELRSVPWNLVTEVIGTFVLVFWVLINHQTPHQLGPLAVALVVVAIGAGLGGPTGYAINPTRDLGPRLAHAVLPIPHKGGSDWGYSWIPVVGPLAGAALAAGTALVWV